MLQNSSTTISRGCLKPTLYAIPHTYGYVVDDMCVCIFIIALGLNIDVKKERIKLASIEYLMNIQSQNDLLPQADT